jgi:hypothetical protein
MSDEKRVLSKSDLLSGKFLRHKLTFVEDWNAWVWLRELSGDVIREYRRRIKELQKAGVKETTPDQDVEIVAFLLANSLCDEQGELQFTEEEAKGLTVNSLNSLTDIINKVFAVSRATQRGDGNVVSEVADNLPNDQTKYLSESSQLNSDEPGQKS